VGTVCGTRHVTSHNYSLATFISALSEVCVQCPVWLFCVVPWCHDFRVCSSDIFWVIFLIFPFSPIIPVSLLSIHPTYTAFMLQCIYILKSLRLPSSTHFYIQELQHLLTSMFLFHYHGLWCPVYCHGWFCQFSIVNSIIRLPYFDGLFRLILIYALTSVPCLLFSKFSWVIIISLLYVAGAGHACASHF